MPERYSPGEILLAALVFTSQAGTKKRPVMVIRDAGADDLLVAPVTSQALGHVCHPTGSYLSSSGTPFQLVIRHSTQPPAAASAADGAFMTSFPAA